VEVGGGGNGCLGRGGCLYIERVGPGGRGDGVRVEGCEAWRL
jgi:hypothetical protein